MGFFQRAAEKSEYRTMLQLSGAVAQYTSLSQGWVDVPCHVANETHHAIWVGPEDRDHSTNAVGIYRCQTHFWGVPMSPSQRASAVGDPESVLSFMLISRLNGALSVTDLGSMSKGVESLAFALTTVDFSEM